MGLTQQVPLLALAVDPLKRFNPSIVLGRIFSGGLNLFTLAKGEVDVLWATSALGVKQSKPYPGGVGQKTWFVTVSVLRVHRVPE